jgi:acyl-[acyl carrier protein]--UDP-N-acetylglucosamine O-acyltransferase
MKDIQPNAVIHPTAQSSNHVTNETYCVIEPGVVIGEDTSVEAHGFTVGSLPDRQTVPDSPPCLPGHL